MRLASLSIQLTLLVLAACSGDSRSSPDAGPQAFHRTDLLPSATRLRTPEGEALRVLCWIPPASALRLAWSGAPPGRIQARRDDMPGHDYELSSAQLRERSASLSLGDLEGAVELVLGGDCVWTELALATPVSSPPRELAGAAKGRDVLLWLCDSLAAGHLSAYGASRPTSPVLEELASEGVLFEQAYSQTSWTLSSVSSLFTSLEQERHGVLRMEDKLPAEATTMAELYRERGYRTAALIQNSVVAAHTALDQGFDSYEEFPYTHEDLERLLERARSLLLEPSTRPLFLYVHLSPPHQPYRPPSPELERFTDPGYEGPVDGSVIACARISKEKPPRDDPGLRQLEALYDGNVLYADRMLGRLVGELRSAERAGRLLLVATADHGEAFLEHGVQGHNAHVYEEMVRIPLVLWAPGALPAARPAAPASLLDLLPTLAELCDLPTRSAAWNGRSLLPAVGGAQDPSERPLYYSARYRDDPTQVQRAVRRGRYKLVARAGERALYDLASDPGELYDLCTDRPILCAVLGESLERWSASARAGAAAVPSAPLSDEARRKVEALGYVGDEEQDEDQGGR